MTFTSNQRIFFALAALLFSGLACHAATRLIIPDTPTPPPPTSTPTFVPTLVPTIAPSATSTLAAYEASCPLIVSQIIEDAISTDNTVHGNEASSEDEVTYMVHYTVIGDELKTPLFYPVKKSLEDEQQDRDAQDEIWNLYTRLIPAEQREVLKGFVIFTDGSENYLASVNQSDKDPYKWDLNVDIADSTQKTSLTYTLIHEQAHLLTLTKDQVEASIRLHHGFDDDTYQEEVDACPQYFTGEGCSNPDSYINEFFNRFWPDIYAEWQEIDEIENERIRENRLESFYDTYEDQFLTDYAPTNPAEDIAESFTFFVLSPRPEQNSIANEKFSFFYEYPDLVDLRTQILDRICTEFQ